MRRVSSRLALSVLSLLIATFMGSVEMTAQAQSGLTGNLTGRVLCSDTQTPCRFATVTLETAPTDRKAGVQSRTPERHNYSAATDLTGSFEIRGVSPGEYFVLGRMQGYLCPYDALQSEREGAANTSPSDLNASLTRVSIASGQTASITISLARGASLGGTVRYDDGAAGINLPVHLFRKTVVGEWKEFVNSAGDSTLGPLGLGVHTDDRGRFYEPSLPAGLYKVMVVLPEAMPLPTTITGRQSLEVVITTQNALRVFNGGKFRLSDTPAIEVQDGDERNDVEISIPTSGLRELRGTVSRQRDQEAIRSGSVQLLDPHDRSVLREASIEEDGSFKFNYVPDGSYLVEIEPGGNERSPESVSALTVPLVVASDLPDLNYVLKQSNR